MNIDHIMALADAFGNACYEREGSDLAARAALRTALEAEAQGLAEVQHRYHYHTISGPNGATHNDGFLTVKGSIDGKELEAAVRSAITNRIGLADPKLMVPLQPLASERRPSKASLTS